MNRYNYDNDELNEYIDEEYEEKQEKDKKDRKNKRVKGKKYHSTKKTTKKSRGRRPKTKVVYKNNDNNTHSGFLSFLLFLIILVLLAVIAYLVYVNYYDKDKNSKQTHSTTTNNNTEEMCEANTTKYTLSSGLNKCSDSTQFKLNVVGTDLTFDISRTSNAELPYMINTIYYNDEVVSNTGITGLSLSDNWDIKTDGNVIYLLIINPDTNILTVIDIGQEIYNDNSNTEYKLSSDVTYTKYTSLGLNGIDTCENYEANNQLEEEMWTKGKLVYENGIITEEDEETVTAGDVCK